VIDLRIVEELVNRRIAALQAIRVVNIPVVLGARGSALAAGAEIHFRLGLNGQATVLTWSLGATVAGVASARTVQLDVQVGATLAAVASICGAAANRPQLATQAERSDQLPSGWSSVTINDPSWLLVTVVSVDGTIEIASLTLRVAVSPR
jgi:hypothetical protein